MELWTIKILDYLICENWKSCKKIQIILNYLLLWIRFLYDYFFLNSSTLREKFDEIILGVFENGNI